MSQQHSPDTTFRMQELTREEIGERARAGAAVVVPLAATEQHGPHLPVCTDSVICEHLTAQAVGQAARHVPVLAAPLLAIGCSHHHLAFGGTVSFYSATYLAMLRDIGESLVTDGFRKIIFLNAHGGNDPLMAQTANDLAVHHPVWTASASYWNIARTALQDAGAGEFGMVPGHAGDFETAAMLALRPDWVRGERIRDTHPLRAWMNGGPPGAFIGKHRELTGHDGFTDAPHRATAERGRAYLQAIANAVAAWLVATWRAMDKGGDPA